VNNTNLILFHSFFELELRSGQIIAFDKGVPIVNALVLNNLCEYRQKSLAKNRFLGLHFFRRQWGPIFNHVYVIGFKAADFVRITQNNGHYAVQGHSRSPIFILIKSPYGLPISD